MAVCQQSATCITRGFSFSGIALIILAAYKYAYKSLPANAYINSYPLLKGSLGSKRDS